jgi:hypothetical protein
LQVQKDFLLEHRLIERDIDLDAFVDTSLLARRATFTPGARAMEHSLC